VQLFIRGDLKADHLKMTLYFLQVFLPIPGTSSVEHLEENVASAKISLSQDEFKEIYRVAHL
jgi:aryl-alcohol dehydrogenase-like predicted oxidoreductase